MKTRYSKIELDLGELSYQECAAQWNDKEVESILFCGTDITSKIQDLGAIRQQLADEHAALFQMLRAG